MLTVPIGQFWSKLDVPWWNGSPDEVMGNRRHHLDHSFLRRALKCSPQKRKLRLCAEKAESQFGCPISRWRRNRTNFGYPHYVYPNMFNCYREKRQASWNISIVVMWWMPFFDAAFSKSADNKTMGARDLRGIGEAMNLKKLKKKWNSLIMTTI